MGWLRAAVLGANDGIVSTASIIVGVAAASLSRATVLTAGCAGLVAGAASMAAGEYVSVSSQADAERADLAVEREELQADPVGEREELAAIYRARGLTPQLADAVADELSAQENLLGVHARDERDDRALPCAPVPGRQRVGSLVHGGRSPACVRRHRLAGRPADRGHDGGDSPRADRDRMGGASPVRGACRVAKWGIAAMLLTMVVGRLVG